MSNSFRKLGLINKIFTNKNTKVLLTLFKSFIRSSLEYSSIIWNPYTRGSIRNVERVQKRMCRLLPEVRYLTYKNQLKVLGLLSLETRRLRFQLITIFKMRKGLIDLDLNRFFVINENRRTRGHSCHIIPKFSKNNYRLNFFTVSAITYWNTLTQEVVDSPSLSIFKIRLARFFEVNDIW